LLFGPNNQFPGDLLSGLDAISSQVFESSRPELGAPQPGVVKTSKFGAHLRVSETIEHALVHWKDYQATVKKSSLWESLWRRLDYCKVQRAG
jgi:hypothetical protein